MYPLKYIKSPTFGAAKKRWLWSWYHRLGLTSTRVRWPSDCGCRVSG